MLAQRSKREYSRIINRLIDSDRYGDARKFLRQLLRESPEDHWLLAMVALTYYEQHRYAEASRFSMAAMKQAPSDPFVLWNHAGIMLMARRTMEAIETYQRLLAMSPKRAGEVECQEGIRWARQILNDARFRLATCFLDIKDYRRAKYYLTKHLTIRKEGVRSLYPRARALRLLEDANTARLRLSTRNTPASRT